MGLVDFVSKVQEAMNGMVRLAQENPAQFSIAKKIVDDAAFCWDTFKIADERKGYSNAYRKYEPTLGYSTSRRLAKLWAIENEWVTKKTWYVEEGSRVQGNGASGPAYRAFLCDSPATSPRGTDADAQCAESQRRIDECVGKVEKETPAAFSGRFPVWIP